MKSIFAERGFRFYFAGQALSFVGDGLRTLAIPLLVFKLTGSALSLGITYALEFLPFALFGLVGGSLADRLDRRRLMIGCDFVRFAIIGLFALAYWRGFLSLTMLYAGIVLVSATAAVFMGGQASSIPYLLGKQRASQAIAALIAAEQTSNLVTPPLGGLLFSLGGPLPALVVNAFTYLTSQISIALVPTMGPEFPGGLPTLKELVADIRESFRFLTADVAMRTVSLMSLGLNMFGMMATAVFIAFLKREFHASDAQVGLSFGIIAVGSLFGSVLAGSVGRSWPYGLSLCIAYTIDGLIFMPVIWAHDLWVVIAFWSLASIAASFEVTQILGWRMRVIPEDKVGRVFGVARLIALIGVVPGTIGGGYLADHFGVRVPIVVSAVGYLLLASVAFAVPALRNDKR
jgi:MFS family permease